MTTAYFGGLDGLDGHDIDSPLTPSGDGLSARKSNVLATKLTNVLSSSYADREIRDALRLLDVRRVQNVEETRRNLRADAQKEVIDSNARIVDDFGKVAEQLQRVGTLITTLNQTCDEMKRHIIAAKQESAPVLEEAGTLIARKKETESKQQLLDAFRKHFLISDEEHNILTNSAKPLDESFFSIVSRTKQIHKDCEILLGYEHQRLGLELMEQTTRNLDAGFKKLYNWIQREFKGLDLEDPHISGSIRRALRVLSERPTMFRNCLDFFAEARENTLADAFAIALTGASGGATKAIEFSTHDPLRYIGDMLAWVHSAAVSEKEALEGLFISDADEISKGLSTGKASEPWARISRKPTGFGIDEKNHDEEDDEVETEFDGQKALSDLVSRNLAGVCQTLQQRVHLAVRNSGEPVVMYKVFNLLTFYHNIFSKLVGEAASITKVIIALKTQTLTQFEETMEEETAAATTDNTPNADLSIPLYLSTTLQQFSDIARSRSAQMDATELERLFSAMLSGALDACAEGAMQIADIRRSNIYKLNYLDALCNTLRTVASQVPSASIPLDKASKEISTLRDQLLGYLVTGFVEDSGVADLHQGIDARRHDAGKHEWLLNNLDAAAQKLDDFLSSALMDTQESLKPLTDKTLAGDIIAEAVDKFCADFDELETALNVEDDQMVDRDSGGDGTRDGQPMNEEQVSLRQLYPRTGAEVRALLS